MSELERQRNLRTQFLKHLYEVSGGDTSGGIQMREIGGGLGLDEEETARVVQWLVDRGFVRWFSMGGNISITPAGVDQAEAALADAAPPPTDDVAVAPAQQLPESGAGDELDLFISHASEDKERFVRPLVAELEARGLRVWFDEAELQVGDSLIEKVDDGLRRSRFGVVILSRAFFAKNWPRAELDALATRQISSGEVVILPIWLDVNYDEVAEFSSLLAGRLALRESEGIAQIADKIATRVRTTAPGSLSTDSPASASLRLEPGYVQNHLQPWSSSPSIRSDERALAVRAALAGSIRTSPEPFLTPREQDALVDAVTDSSLERLMVELTERGGRRTRERLWQPVEPTNTWIITLARPPMPRVMYEGFSVEGRAHVTLRPIPGAGTGQWLILGLDAFIRPPESDAERSGGTPLSLDDFHSLLYAPLSALLEIAPVVLTPLNDGAPRILSVGCLLVFNGGGLSDYLRLGTYASGRTGGASDPSAIYWLGSNLDEIEAPNARLETTRRLVERFFIDGGYRGYEHAIEHLEATS